MPGFSRFSSTKLRAKKNFFSRGVRIFAVGLDNPVFQRRVIVAERNMHNASAEEVKAVHVLGSGGFWQKTPMLVVSLSPFS